MGQLGYIFTFIQDGTYDICSGPVFWYEFNGTVHFAIRLLYLVISLFYIYVYALYTIFLIEFSCNNNYGIWRLYFDDIWYGHHQASFFSANSATTVIMSSSPYLLGHFCKIIIFDLRDYIYISFLIFTDTILQAFTLITWLSCICLQPILLAS